MLKEERGVAELHLKSFGTSKIEGYLIEVDDPIKRIAGLDRLLELAGCIFDDK